MKQKFKCNQTNSRRLIEQPGKYWWGLVCHLLFWHLHLSRTVLHSCACKSVWEAATSKDSVIGFRSPLVSLLGGLRRAMQLRGCLFGLQLFNKLMQTFAVGKLAF
jgi:hypothetical protein